MIFHFAQFKDPEFPADNEIFEPGYPTEQEADARIAIELEAARQRMPMYTEMNDKKPWNYSVLSLKVDIGG